MKPGRIDTKFHRYLLDAFDRRLQADYNFALVITDEEVISMIDKARNLLVQAEALLDVRS